MTYCKFVGLTKKQAKILAEWYEGQGEQDASYWFEVAGVPTPITNCSRKGGYKEIDKDGNVIIYCEEENEIT